MVIVCGQERELPMLPDTPVRANATRRGMVEQLWGTSLRLDDEAEQTIDCKHSLDSKGEFPIMAKVCTTCTNC